MNEACTHQPPPEPMTDEDFKALEALVESRSPGGLFDDPALDDLHEFVSRFAFDSTYRFRNSLDHDDEEGGCDPLHHLAVVQAALKTLEDVERRIDRRRELLAHHDTTWAEHLADARLVWSEWMRRDDDRMARVAVKDITNVDDLEKRWHQD